MPPRRFRLDRQRVQPRSNASAIAAFTSPVALDPALADEDLRRDVNPEVGFAALAPVGMPGMLVRHVGHRQGRGRNRSSSVPGDPLFQGHGLTFS
jgi:hypothetical protein